MPYCFPSRNQLVPGGDCSHARTHSHTHVCSMRFGPVLLLRLRKTLQLARRNAGRKMTALLLQDIRCCSLSFRTPKCQPFGRELFLEAVSFVPKAVLLGNGAAVLLNKKMEKCFQLLQVASFYFGLGFFPSPGCVSKDNDVVLPAFVLLLLDVGCNADNGFTLVDKKITISVTCDQPKRKHTLLPKRTHSAHTTALTNAFSPTHTSAPHYAIHAQLAHTLTHTLARSLVHLCDSSVPMGTIFSTFHKGDG